VSDRDPFDDLVLDEAFVRAGRPEEPADRRLERYRRIATESRTSEGWRQGSDGAAGAVGAVGVAGVAAPRRREPGRARRLVVAVSVVAGLLAAVVYLDRTSADDAVPASARQDAGSAPGAVPGSAPDDGRDVLPARLAPLPPDPGGEGGYRFLQTQDDATGRPVAYDPCRPIRYVLRRVGEPAGGEALVVGAVAEISAATGLVFERGADTDEPLVDDRKPVQPDRYGPGPAPVLIAWSDERESPDLAGYIAGYAGSAIDGWKEPGTWRYVTGTVVLDAEDALPALQRPGGAAQVRSTILHELGHLVGLNHVADRGQLMFSEGGDNRLELGAGDRRGLRLLGDGRCFTDWDELLAAG
jgi:hypothetical protein